MEFKDTILSAAAAKQPDLLRRWPCVFVESICDSELLALIGSLACPVILIGDRRFPHASAFDAIVADRAEASRLFACIKAIPHAARTLVRLLRQLPSMSVAAGLEAESLTYAELQGGHEFLAWLKNRGPLAPDVPSGEIVSRRDEDRLIVTMNRPGAGNAIDCTMRDGLAEMFQLAVMDESIKRIVLRGAGKAFSVGADLSEFGTTRNPEVAHAIRQQTLPAHWAWKVSKKFEAYIQGACIGAGLELAAFASRITASERAWFQLPELRMGLLPGAGGCVSLTQRIGRQRTAELVLSGKRISARTALQWGLIDEIASNDGGADEL